MLMLLNCHSLGTRPTHVTAKAVCPGGTAVVLILFPVAGGAVLVGAFWMKPMQMAVGAHVPEFCHLGPPGHALSAAVSVGATVGIAVLIVAYLCGHGSNGGSELLDFSLHCHQLFLYLLIAGFAGCVGCTHHPHLLAAGCIRGSCLRLWPFGWRIHSNCVRPSLPSVFFVGVGGLDDALKVGSRQVVIGLHGCWLLFPHQHLLLVKAVAIVDFLQIKLELVVIGDGDV